ncbi:MAG TPA: LacI family DNA-binding transcriptional regulator [Bauldia sp.]|nr:LacI family DNA-binding transcriptional regulator [Bauldia sp.]
MSRSRQFRRVKITDVAQSLGLSVSTVSRALNGYADVNAETRRRISEQAERMGYTPSRVGLRLRKGRSHAVGFVIPPFGSDFADPVFLSVLAGADQRLRREGVQLLVTTAASEDDELRAMRRMIEGDQVDSMILVRLRREDPRVAYLHEQGIPMSLLGRSRSVPSAPSVEIDTALGVVLAVTHLAGLRRRRLAHVNAPQHYNYGLDRAEAFRECLATLALDPSEQTEMTGDLTEQGGYRAALSLLDRPTPPDGIVFANDAMAIGAMHAIVSRGYRPGEDISLVGFSDVPVASLVNPPLTTLRVPYKDLGALVADHLLLDLSGRNDGSLSHVARPELIVRQT